MQIIRFVSLFKLAVNSTAERKRKMNKLFSKIATLSVGLAMAIGVGVAIGSKQVKVAKADSINFDISKFNGLGTANTGSAMSATDGSITLDFSKGYGSSNTDVRSYAGGSLTFSGVTFTEIVITATGTADNRTGGVWTPSTGTVSKDGATITWTGTASSALTLANASQLRMASLSITYDSGTVDTLESITVSGAMTKTEYTTAESWSAAGLVATGTYSASGEKDITDKVTWTYNPSAPATSVTSVVATATLGSVSGDSAAQTVTVTAAPAQPGTEDNPYTVAQARAAIDASSGTSGVYATGIVSEIVTVYSTQYKNVTFNFSTDGTTTSAQLQAFREKSDYSSTVKVGDIVVVKGNLKKYSSTYEFDTGCTITSLTEPGGTKYSVIDRVDDGSLDKEEVSEGATLNVRILPETGFWYPESVTVLMAGNPVEFTYANGVVTVENVTGNVSIEGACVACNQIKSLYAKPNGVATGDFYGYYVGYLTHTNKDGDITYYDYIVQDGEYGIMLYGASTNAPEFVASETILKASGTISIYNGLYEINPIAVESVTTVPEGKVPSSPVVYAAKGGETAIYANRLTTVTGVPAVTKGSFEADAGTADITMNFTVGANTVQVFYKKAAQTADAEAFAAVKAAVEGSSEVTVKGFTGWYNGFQVQMNGYVKPSEDYTALIFAQDLLAQTDAVCTGWEEGVNNHDALEAIWTDLASDDKYPALPAAQKTILAEAARDPEGTDIEKAMARYDFLTGKYNLSNFINGRTPIASANTRFGEADLVANDNTMIIVITIAAVSALAFTTLLVFKKKKQK